MRDFIDFYLNKPGMELGRHFYDTMLIVQPDAVVTTGVFVRFGIMYLALHPEVQKKAQAEIDDVVGSDEAVSISFS